MSYASPTASPKSGLPPTASAAQKPTAKGSTLQKSAPTGKKPTYDVTNVASDWTTIRQIRTQFDQDVTLKIDQLYRQRDPDTPYLNIPDRDGTTNLAKQVVDPTITFYVDKGTPYNLSGEISTRCPAEFNHGSPRNLGLAEDTIAFTFRHNARRAPLHWSDTLVHRTLMLHGWCPVELSWPADDQAKEMLGGYPLKLTAHDPLSIAYEFDAAGLLARVIVGKRMLVGELPDAWKSGTLAGKADTDEVTLFQDYNKFTFSAVVDNALVDQYDHQYVDLMGDPMVPWVIEFHDPMTTTLGDAAPQLSYSSSRKLWVGRPPVMGLIKMLEYRSFLMSGQRFNIREFLTSWVKVIGDVDVDWDGKQATVTTMGGGDFQFEEPPNVLQNIEAGLTTSDQMIQAGGIGQGTMTGDKTRSASGVAEQAATDFVKTSLESVRRTHERLLERCGEMILAMVKSHTQASLPRRIQAKTGAPPHPDVLHQMTMRNHAANGAPGQDPYDPTLMNQGALPYYWWITGDVRVPIDDLTVAGVVAVESHILPFDGFPKEQRVQMFMNIQQMEAQSGKKVLPDDLVYGDIWGASNPQAILDRIATDQYMADPAKPYGKIRALRVMATERMASNSANPQFWQNAQSQLDQAEDTLYQKDWQQSLAMLAQGPPPPGAPPPNGGPPPQGGQAPGPPPGQGPPGPPGTPPPPVNGMPAPPPQAAPPGGMQPPQGPPTNLPAGLNQAPNGVGAPMGNPMQGAA